MTQGSETTVIDNVQTTVADQVRLFTERWWSCESGFPELGPTYSLQEQISREKDMGSRLEALYSELKKPAPPPAELELTQERLIRLFIEIAKSALGLEERHFDYLLENGLRRVTSDFTQMARQFDPYLNELDIYQAYRNSSSMHLMQLLFSLPVEITPSVFAFSMLYPYTDNFLDDPAIPPEDKQGFNRRFRMRILGENPAPANQHEALIGDLIGMIEDQYERSRYPHIFDSLLAIQDAQVKSVKLLRRQASPYEVDILSTCFEKGGTAALADGYLVAGDLTQQQKEFVFFYGVYTQLVDDLEDVHADRDAGINTLFSQTAGHWPLDGVTNRLFHFGRQALAALDGFPDSDIEPLKEMMGICFTPMLIDSASSAGKYYSRSYLRKLQTHFPFRFSFLKKQRKRFARKGDSLKLMLEALMMYTLVGRQHS
jgi:hypothetical protein